MYVFIPTSTIAIKFRYVPDGFDVDTPNVLNSITVARSSHTHTAAWVVITFTTNHWPFAH